MRSEYDAKCSGDDSFSSVKFLFDEGAISQIKWIVCMNVGVSNMSVNDVNRKSVSTVTGIAPGADECTPDFGNDKRT
jgi:hypothetical protein